MRHEWTERLPCYHDGMNNRYEWSEGVVTPDSEGEFGHYETPAGRHVTIPGQVAGEMFRLAARVQELEAERKETGEALRELALVSMSLEEWPGTLDIAETVGTVHAATNANLATLEEENRRLRVLLGSIVYREGPAVLPSFKEDTDLAELFPDLPALLNGE